MEFNLGISGAKRTSYNEYNLRDLLLKVRADNPKCDDIDQLRDLLLVEVKKVGNEGYREICLEYACARTVFNTFTLREKKVEEIVAAKVAQEKIHQEKTDQVQLKLKARIKAEAIILLDLRMPNGKLLGDCSKADLKKFSGWESQLADKLTGRQKVEEVFSERQIRDIYKRHSIFNDLISALASSPWKSVGFASKDLIRSFRLRYLDESSTGRE